MGIFIKADNNIFSDKNLGQLELVDGLVEYLESDGQAYIDTLWSGYRKNSGDVAGTIPSNAPSFEIKIAVEETSYMPILGVLSRAQPNVNTNGNIIQYIGKGAHFNSITLASGENVLKVGSVYSYINNTQISDNLDMDNQYRLNAFNDSILLFGGYYTMSGGSAFEISSHTKIYYFKAYEGDTLVLDLRPYRYNGVGCMIDVLTNTLYMNAGDGAFKMGSIIN